MLWKKIACVEIDTLWFCGFGFGSRKEKMLSNLSFRLMNHWDQTWIRSVHIWRPRDALVWSMNCFEDPKMLEMPVSCYICWENLLKWSGNSQRETSILPVSKGERDENLESVLTSDMEIQGLEFVQLVFGFWYSFVPVFSHYVLFPTLWMIMHILWHCMLGIYDLFLLFSFCRWSQ